MTYREKLKIDFPQFVSEKYQGGCNRCPRRYYKMSKSREKCFMRPFELGRPGDELCRTCWNQEMEEDVKYVK